MATKDLSVREHIARLRQFNHKEAAAVMEMLFEEAGALLDEKLAREAELWPSAEEMAFMAATYDYTKEEAVF